MRQPKLIAGNKNVLLTICKVGYAEGYEKPKLKLVPKPFNAVIKLRKQEYKAA